ncbi:MAG: arylsulfatase [Opitutus sp.]|nr:arylsulfatase [Opitutus sp.]
MPLPFSRIRTCGLKVLALAALATGAGRAAPSPNIVVILADDMGFSDLGCYGGEIATPHLDRLAGGGIRFTQFYNTSRCCPTRAALLTGLYSHQAGIGLITEDLGHDGYRGDLSRQAVTIPEVLQGAGYRSYMTGKWHVTKQTGPNGDKANWPRQRGFDRFYGTITGAGSYYDPATLCRENTYVTPPNDTEYQPPEFHYTDAVTDNAVRFISEHHRDHGSQPFFLYVAYTSPHWPLHAPPQFVDKYRGRYDEGYAPIRRQRFQRARELGLIDPRWRISPDAQNWAATVHQAWEIRCMEVYAAMIEQMDAGIGRLVAELARQGRLQNTLIVYLQDNGACAEGYGRASNADKIAGTSFPPLGRNDLQTKIWPPMQTRDGHPLKTGPEAMPGPADTFVAYGRGWANVSNTPFRGYKHDSLEGGITTPCIMHWPAGIGAAQRNSILPTPAHLIDLMATLVDVSGARYPAEYRGEQIKPLEGISLRPAFAGRPVSRQAPLGFEHHGNAALRDGRWKIVKSYRAEEPVKWELYDMEADRTELDNLAERMPERVAELSAKWQAWARHVGVVAWPVRKQPGKTK